MFYICFSQPHVSRKLGHSPPNFEVIASPSMLSQSLERQLVIYSLALSVTCKPGRLYAMRKFIIKVFSMGSYQKAKGRSKGQFVCLRHDIMKSKAWRSLSPSARCLWTEIVFRFNGRNNGNELCQVTN